MQLLLPLLPWGLTHLARVYLQRPRGATAGGQVSLAQRTERLPTSSPTARSPLDQPLNLTGDSFSLMSPLIVGRPAPAEPVPEPEAPAISARKVRETR